MGIFEKKDRKDGGGEEGSVGRKKIRKKKEG